MQSKETDSNSQIPFAKPAIGTAEIAEVAAVLESGWISSGPKTIEFERSFAKFLEIETNKVVSLNSATAGLHLALEAIDINANSKVIVPTMTFTATAEVVRYFDAQVILVDSVEDGPEISFEEISRIHSEWHAIIPVHFAGIPLDIKGLRKQIGQDKIIIEDAAHAFPAKFDSAYVGSMASDATVFSFYANKTITTGEGGMVTSQNIALIERIKIMRSHGMSQNVYERYQGTSTAKSTYDILAPGYKYNLTDIAAAIGIVQLGKAEAMRLNRKKICEIYFAELSDLDFRLPKHFGSLIESAFHLFTIELSDDNQKFRDLLIAHLTNHGIMTSLHYKPLHLMKYWREYLGVEIGQFPNAERRYRNTISLPLFSEMTSDQAYRVTSTIRGFFDEYQ